MVELSIIQKIAIWAIPLLFAISLHEVAHGWVASWFGDYTARLSGRLSLNPIKHIDPVGTIAAPLLTMLVSNFNFVFGWAKPVPVDPRNMRNPRRNMAIVALAGPAANILMALAWGLIAKLGIWIDTIGNDWFGIPLIYMGSAGIMINVVLAVLNLIPLPPLDGAKILTGILPGRSAYYFHLVEPYGFIILLLLMFTGVLSLILGPPVYFLINGIGSLFGLA
jgi:Zn-dependent protease